MMRSQNVATVFGRKKQPDTIPVKGSGNNHNFENHSPNVNISSGNSIVTGQATGFYSNLKFEKRL